MRKVAFLLGKSVERFYHNGWANSYQNSLLLFCTNTSIYRIVDSSFRSCTTSQHYFTVLWVSGLWYLWLLPLAFREIVATHRPPMLLPVFITDACHTHFTDCSSGPHLTLYHGLCVKKEIPLSRKRFTLTYTSSIVNNSTTTSPTPVVSL